MNAYNFIYYFILLVFFLLKYMMFSLIVQTRL